MREIWKILTKRKNEETRIMRLMFEEILHALITSTKENIEERVGDEAEEGVAKAETDIVNKILEKHLYSSRCSLCYGLNN